MLLGGPLDRAALWALAAGAVSLLAWTAASFSLVSLTLVVASLMMAGVSLWSCRTLYGARAAWIFFAAGAVLGWSAEQMGSSRGWFFGSYTYTDVLGPRLGDVPLVIPCMWFGLTHIGLVIASLALWRRPAPEIGSWKLLGLAAFASAMIVTAFDLGADPYFVYQLKAWIMEKKDGHWFGETVRGFEGWMVVSFAIVAVFLAVARPSLVTTPDDKMARRAALAPIVIYAFEMVFQVVVSEPIALRFIAFFAMGIPSLIAAMAWWEWRGVQVATAQERTVQGPALQGEMD